MSVEYEAYFVDLEAFSKQFAAAEDECEFLETVESENVDLHISLGENRKWVGISGRNIPSFEIFVSPDWRGTRGTYYADQPSYRNGNYVKGVRLKFEKGRLTNIGAVNGQNFVKQQLRMPVESPSRKG